MSFLLCIHGTEIKNGPWWSGHITALQNHPPVILHPLVRIPQSCITVGQQYQKHILHFNISFPAQPKCKNKRAWYDTLLGATGTCMGLVNSIDVETLANRLHNTGKDIAQALTNVQWMPTIMKPHELTLNYDKEFMQLFNISQIGKLKQTQKISKVFSWSKRIRLKKS